MIRRKDIIMELTNIGYDVEAHTSIKNGVEFRGVRFMSDSGICPIVYTDEIIENLRPHIANISPRTYYRKRPEAVQALSSILWGYTSKGCLEMLDKFFPEGK